jgi:hypothetical protein
MALSKPEVKAVQDSNWEHDCTSQQKAPQAFCKTSKNVIEPCSQAG